VVLVVSILGAEIAYNGDTEALIRQLDRLAHGPAPPNSALQKVHKGCQPTFPLGISEGEKEWKRMGVFPIFMESDLTVDLLNESPILKRHFYAWAPEDIGHLKVLEEAFQLSDRLTCWLRGYVGWTAGVKPYVNLYDFMVGFQPRCAGSP
jgi:hypothetical protein